MYIYRLEPQLILLDFYFLRYGPLNILFDFQNFIFFCFLGKLTQKITNLSKKLRFDPNFMRYGPSK
jgi:hypothetical protein